MEAKRHTIPFTPNQLLPLNKAARFLGVHRCTIYDYINATDRPLPFVKSPDGKRLMFRVIDLMKFKATGFPKRGRKRKNRL